MPGTHHVTLLDLPPARSHKNHYIIIIIINKPSPSSLHHTATALDGNAKRTLLLVTKMLQSLAKADGSKEDHMKHFWRLQRPRQPAAPIQLRRSAHRTRCTQPMCVAVVARQLTKASIGD
jgi:hypothetical protein